MQLEKKELAYSYRISISLDHVLYIFLFTIHLHFVHFKDIGKTNLFYIYPFFSSNEFSLTNNRRRPGEQKQEEVL